MHARESGSPLLPKPIEQFRDYAHARPRVEEFYALNHTHQTLDFVLEKKREYLALNRKTLTVWEALDYPQYARRRQRSRTSISRRSSTRCRRPRRSAPPTSHAGSSSPDSSTTSARSSASSASRSGPSSATRFRWAAAGRRRSSTAISSARTPIGQVPEYQTEIRHLRARLRPRPRAHVVGPRRVRLSRRQGLPA